MKRYLRPLLYELAVAAVVAAIAFKVTTLEWTIAYTFSALTISLVVQVLVRVEGMGATSQDIFQASSIAHNLLRIRERRNRLFTSISEQGVMKLRILLRRLGNGEHIAEGDEVFAIYSRLILNLKKGDDYWATTYVNDKFWDEIGGEYFFDCNKRAIGKGARITRVFLYTDDTADFTQFPVVKKHIELKQELDKKLKSNLKLHKLNVSRADSLKHVVEDKGILKDTFVMKLTVAPATVWKRATVNIDKDILEEEKRLFQRLLDDHEHLEPLEHTPNLTGAKVISTQEKSLRAASPQPENEFPLDQN